MRLRHEQEQVFLADETQAVQGYQVNDAPWREVEQGDGVLVAASLRSLIGFDKVTQLGIEQSVDGSVGLRRNHFGAFQQVTVHRPGGS